MDVDIFMYAERRNGDHWELASPMEENEWRADDNAPQYKPAELYKGRWYPLWTILAGVMNPARSVVGYEPVAPPRGLPDDLSPEVRGWWDSWEPDPSVYGWSWLLLSELEAFDWNKTILKEAKVDDDLAPLFQDDQPFPADRWPEGRIQGYRVAAEYSPGTVVRWTETYAESATEEFMQQVLPQLRGYGSPDDVRIVFWFEA